MTTDDSELEVDTELDVEGDKDEVVVSAAAEVSELDEESGSEVSGI
ncbi:MAG: hypothetical protein AAGA65_28880 [Actinomycetota bacterium]